MTTIYLIRHAEAEGNLYRIAQGQYNSLLTDRGQRQVAALEARFADIHVDAVYSSDLYRTCATAAAIYRPKGRRSIAAPTCGRSAWAFGSSAPGGDIARTDPEQMENFSRHPERWQVEGGEPPARVLARCGPRWRTSPEKTRENRGGLFPRLRHPTAAGVPSGIYH